MRHQHKSTETVTEAASRRGYVRLHHGTTKVHAISIVTYGVSAEKARPVGSAGAFWATRESFTAKSYAKLPPADNDSVILSFDFPEAVLEQLIRNGSARTDVLRQTFEFHPESHEAINSVMTDIQLTAIPNQC